MTQTLENYKKSELEMIFSNKKTENGDDAYNTTGNKLSDILFLSNYFSKNLNLVSIGTTKFEKAFSMFIRDPRNGLGFKDLGRDLMYKSGCTLQDVVKAGSFNDLRCYDKFYNEMYDEYQKYLKSEIDNGNELAKKWAPRYSGKHLMLARKLANTWGMNKQTYGKFVKTNTVENKLSSKNVDDIKFESVPSNAMVKYYNRFMTKEDTSERFKAYLEEVKNGTKKLNISTTTVYDIFRNCNKIDPDLFFDKIEKIKINCIPVLDTSGSMWDSNDSIGKAMSIAHYLGKCSTYCKDMVVSFSSNPKLLKLGEYDERQVREIKYMMNFDFNVENSNYLKEIASMFTGDCSNTDLGAVFELFGNIKSDFPEYIVVLSDMEFDCGSKYNKDKTMKIFKDNGIETKIIWWNFNNRSNTVPETDEYGNIFMSGYSPMLLKFLESGFDSDKFITKLVNEYAKKMNIEL